MTKQILAILCVFIVVKSHGQTDSAKGKKVKVLPVPTFGYSPETETYVGAVSLFALDFYQDGYTRTSNAKVELTYTWNKQIILELGWDYFFRRERWFSQGRLHISNYPDRYYGIGSSTTDSSETWFSSNRFIAEFSLLKAIKQKMFLGPEIKYTSYANVNENTTNNFEELTDRQNVAIALVYLWDTRNNLLNAKTGHYVKAVAGQSWNGEQNNPSARIDLRYYKTWKNRFTVASRLYSSINLGTPTFYNYSILGGDLFVRGYLYGRFRDLNLSTIQLESRVHLFWRIGIAVFGGYSYLFEHINQQNASQFKYNAGGGLRFLVDRKGDINLRLDYAIGENGQTGFYVAFGESF